jgi:hypothetical protein
MTDTEIRKNLADLTHSIEKRTGNKPFFALLWPSKTDDRAIFVGNVKQTIAIAAMKDFISQHDTPTGT